MRLRVIIDPFTSIKYYYYVILDKLYINYVTQFNLTNYIILYER